MGLSQGTRRWFRRFAVAVAVLASLSILLVVAVPRAGASAGQFFFYPNIEAGDVDCSGEMNVIDALRLLRVVVEEESGRQSCARVGEVEINLGRGDLDGDGIVTANDALIILGCIVRTPNLDCPGFSVVLPGFGDVNCDGVFDPVDADLLSNLGRRPEPSGSRCDPSDDSVLDLSVGDFTRNGEVTRADGMQAHVCFIAYAKPLQVQLDGICPRIGNEAPLMLGDADCNGVVDGDDAAAIVDYVNGIRRGLQTCVRTGSGGGFINLERSELNRDGVVDLADATVLESCVAQYDFRSCPHRTRPDAALPDPPLNVPWRGDVTCDGELTAQDAQALNSFLLNGVGGDDLTCGAPSTTSTTWNASRGDMDGDQQLTYEDLVLLEDCVDGRSNPLFPCPVDDPDFLAPEADTTSPVMGDVDCDGQRTSTDAAFLQDYLDGNRSAGSSCAARGAGELNEARADIDRDGRIDASDITLLVRCIDDETAAGCPARSCGAADAVTADCVHDQRVLSLRWIPIDPENPTMLDPWALSESDVEQPPTIRELLAFIIETEAEAVQLMSDATRYRHRDNPGAAAAIEFDIVASRNIFERPPLGLPFQSARRPDYNEMFTRPDIDICDWVDNQGIDEVWLWTMHTAIIEPTESNMSSSSSLPFIDVSNSERTDDLPHCERTYVVYNANFRRGADALLHIRGHHMEALLKWRADDRQVFLYDGYVGEGNSYYELVAPLGFYRCGNIHRAPNAPVEDIDGVPTAHTWLDRSVDSDCPNWERTGGVPESVNCSTWFEPFYGSPDCFDDAGISWYVYWFEGLPGLANGIIDEGRQWRNVFDAMGDPDSLLRSASHLFETEQVATEDALRRSLAANDYDHHNHLHEGVAHSHDD